MIGCLNENLQAVDSTFGLKFEKIGLENELIFLEKT